VVEGGVTAQPRVDEQLVMCAVLSAVVLVLYNHCMFLFLSNVLFYQNAPSQFCTAFGEGFMFRFQLA
jgi:hypothetical protein